MERLTLTRKIHPDTMNAIVNGGFYYIWLVEIDWPTGTVRAHSGVGTIRFDGADWYGVGNFGQIGLPDESSGLAAFPASFELVGLPDDLSLYLNQNVRDRSVNVYCAITADRNGTRIIGEPIELWNGYADAMVFHASTTGYGIEYGLRLEARGGPCVRATASVYHTDEDQSRRHPGDTAGRLTINAEAEGVKLTWPES